MDRMQISPPFLLVGVLWAVLTPSVRRMYIVPVVFFSFLLCLVFVCVFGVLSVTNVYRDNLKEKHRRSWAVYNGGFSRLENVPEGGWYSTVR